jgi:hypothetical protein
MTVAVFWDVARCSLAVYRRFRGVCASEMSADVYQPTQRNISEDSRRLFGCLLMFLLASYNHLQTELLTRTGI